MSVVEALRKMPSRPTRLERDDFETFAGESGSRTLVASFEAPYPLVLRGDRPLRIIVTAFETFETDGSGSTQTFELTHDLVESPQSADVRVFADGERAKPEAINYDDDEIEYADGGDVEELAVYYISGEDMEFEIEKEAPSTDGSASERVFSTPLALMHQRDQDEQPRTFDVGQSTLQPVVPTDWKLNVYTDGDYSVTFEDDDTGTVARNAVLSLPIKQGNRPVDGLGREVAHDIVDRS